MNDPMDRQAIVDLAAIRGNVAALRERVRGSEVMAVVKADGYGHGMVPAARAALAGGASWLGTEADAIEARRLEHARRAAGQLGVTVLLKGSTTVVADRRGGPVFVNPTGTPWLATAGTGDVLSGLAGALLAQGLAPAEAGITAAYLHGIAARLAAAGPAGPAGAAGEAGEAPIGAHDVITALPAAIRAVAAA